MTRAADVEVVATTQVEAPAANTEAASTELPDIVKTVQEAVMTLSFTINHYLILVCELELDCFFFFFLLLLKWEKVEDKYAVSSLAVSGFVALWGTAGVISVRRESSLHLQNSLVFQFLFYLVPNFEYCVVKQAIDRLPLVPGVLEVVGIGYTGVSFYLFHLFLFLYNF